MLLGMRVTLVIYVSVRVWLPAIRLLNLFSVAWYQAEGDAGGSSFVHIPVPQSVQLLGCIAGNRGFGSLIKRKQRRTSSATTQWLKLDDKADGGDYEGVAVG